MGDLTGRPGYGTEPDSPAADVVAVADQALISDPSDSERATAELLNYVPSPAPCAPGRRGSPHVRFHGHPARVPWVTTRREDQQMSAQPDQAPLTPYAGAV